MEALAHKLDSAVKDAWSATKDTVQDKIGQVTRHLQDGKQTVQDRVQEAQVPEPVAGRIDQLTQAVRQRPVPAAAIGLVVLVLLLLRLFRGTA